MMMPGNQYRAWCRQCGCPLISQLKVLLDHARCRKHVRREGRAPVEPPIKQGGRLGPASKAGAWGKRERDSGNQQLDVSYGVSHVGERRGVGWKGDWWLTTITRSEA